MSTRVNKQIGYGLKNLRTKKGDDRSWEPKDPRWDYAKFRADWLDDVDKERDLRQYLHWCKAHKDDLVSLMAAERGRVEGASTDHFLMVEGLKDRLRREDTHWNAPYSAVLWDYEAGLKNAVLFTPAEHYHDWRRHDDIMDYYEEAGPNGPQVRATFLKGSSGIWPHSGVMKRFRPPTRDLSDKLTGITTTLQAYGHDIALNRGKDGAEIEFLPAGNFNQLTGLWDPKQQPLLRDPDLLKHFREDWRPILPMGVFALIEYLGCFPDAYGLNGIVNSLRPMICVTWG